MNRTEEDLVLQLLDYRLSVSSAALVKLFLSYFVTCDSYQKYGTISFIMLGRSRAKKQPLLSINEKAPKMSVRTVHEVQPILCITFMRCH